MRRMLGWGLLVLCAACGASRPAVVRAPAAQASVEESSPTFEEPRSTARRYVDEDLGFEIIRPGAEWQLAEKEEQNTPEGLTIPVVLRHRATRAEVVLQVAPAVATPIQFAERLNQGLREQPGFIASELEPLALSDSAVGFNFEVGADVRGRVAVTEGSPGRVFMMLATWPSDAPAGVSQSVETLFGAVRPLPERGL
ncbi:hypothetical protein [Hyalangium rubrum]|uniref:Lipoprotein n=1 Tax=Hyalangium rubrum TaxID=3103134 RepID=A0ABU5H8C8_9BACT|nr:hypothetical protein [Hyalangium sp. s54d21]MDY7229733.1 hypothetical protein [Hyalangium sp. s54d21]